jgi:hypothetical protein
VPEVVIPYLLPDDHTDNLARWGRVTSPDGWLKMIACEAQFGRSGDDQGTEQR